MARLETKEEYEARMKASTEKKIEEEEKSEWYKAIDKFFERKIETALGRGDKPAATFYAELGNEFFKGAMTYYYLGYEEALKAGTLQEVED
jgi:hypothetical protein